MEHSKNGKSHTYWDTTMTRPNIIIYLSDDLGYGDVGCFGSTQHQTPRIDQLAAEGVRCTDFHSNGCMCSPTRAALLTGRYQQRCGIEWGLGNAIKQNGPRFGGMSPEETTFGRTFSEAGYKTGFFGKFHTGVMPDYSPIKIGFQEFAGINGGMDHHSRYDRNGKASWFIGEDNAFEDGYATDLITDHGLDFIDRHKDEPFVLYLADWCVHFPWQGPNDGADFADGVDNSGKPNKYGSQYPDEHKRAYKEMTEAQDRNVGRIVDKLRDHGIAENTLFVFTSDNGGQGMVTDNAPLRGGKSQVFEGGHRVPAIFWWPGTLPAGETREQAIMTMDLFPTMLSVTGVQPPADRPLDGVDVSRYLIEGEPLEERALFWRMGEKEAARRGDWKYVKNGDDEYLFNLADDLSEAHDRMSDEPNVAQSLKDELAAWAQDVETNRIEPYWLKPAT